MMNVRRIAPLLSFSTHIFIFALSDQGLTEQSGKNKLLPVTCHIGELKSHDRHFEI